MAIAPALLQGDRYAVLLQADRPNAAASRSPLNTPKPRWLSVVETPVVERSRNPKPRWLSVVETPHARNRSPLLTVNRQPSTRSLQESCSKRMFDKFYQVILDTS